MSDMVVKMQTAGFITAPEAAKLAGVTVYSIYRWVEQKKIAGTQVGAHWFIDKNSLATYLGPVAAQALRMGELVPVK